MNPDRGVTVLGILLLHHIFRVHITASIISNKYMSLYYFLLHVVNHNLGKVKWQSFLLKFNPKVQVDRHPLN